MINHTNKNWTSKDWKWLVGILIGAILLIAAAWLSNITDVSNYFSFLGTGISIVLALVAIYISLSQNNNAQMLNTKTDDMLIRIEERIGNVKEKVDKFDSEEIAKIVGESVGNILQDDRKTIFNELEKSGVDKEKIESVKVAVPVANVLIQKIGKIIITTDVLSSKNTAEGPIMYGRYEVYDQYGSNITSVSKLSNNLIFKSRVGIATGYNGIFTVRDLEEVIPIVILTIEDTATGVSATATLLCR